MMILRKGAFVLAAAIRLSGKTTDRFTAVPVRWLADEKKSASANGMHGGKRGCSPHSELKITILSMAEKTVETRCQGGMMQASGWMILNADMVAKSKGVWNMMKQKFYETVDEYLMAMEINIEEHAELQDVTMKSIALQMALECCLMFEAAGGRDRNNRKEGQYLRWYAPDPTDPENMKNLLIIKRRKDEGNAIQDRMKSE